MQISKRASADLPNQPQTVALLHGNANHANETYGFFNVMQRENGQLGTGHVAANSTGTNIKQTLSSCGREKEAQLQVEHSRTKTRTHKTKRGIAPAIHHRI